MFIGICLSLIARAAGVGGGPPPADLSVNSYVVDGYADDYFADESADLSVNSYVVNGYADDYFV